MPAAPRGMCAEHAPELRNRPRQCAGVPLCAQDPALHCPLNGPSRHCALHSPSSRLRQWPLPAALRGARLPAGCQRARADESSQPPSSTVGNTQVTPLVGTPDGEVFTVLAIPTFIGIVCCVVPRDRGTSATSKTAKLRSIVAS